MRLTLLAALWLCLFFGATFSHDGHDHDHNHEEREEADEVDVSSTVGVEELHYVSPTPQGDVYFAEHFDNPEEFEGRWVRSQAKKDGADEEIAKYDGWF